MENNVLEKIVESKRMPVLFIGSGISKRYLYHYPDWRELLKLSFEKVNPDPYYYQKYFDQFSRKGLSDFDINIALGTIIENEFNSAFYDRKIKLKIGAKNPSWVKRGVSPYKMFLSQHFKRMRLNYNPALISELEKFKSLKNKISAVITTNYDTFLEDIVFSSDYQVFVHQNELFSSDSYNIAEIYKIHGSVTDADSIMISKADYDAFHDSRKLIIAKMLTLFAESPIVFLGYSFTDEDIQKIISEFLSCLTSKELEHIDEHFVFISYKKGEQKLEQIKRTITNKDNIQLPITEIRTDNYGEVYNILNKIIPGIAPTRVRETRKIVKHIVDQSILSGDADSVIVGIDDISGVDLSKKPLAIAIGYRENILNKVGYGMLSFELLLEDIIYDNKNFDGTLMCTDRFKSLPYTRLVPVFKYVRQYGQEIAADTKLGIYIEKHNTIEKIIPKNVEKSLKNIPDTPDLDQLLSRMALVDDCNKKAGIVLKNINHLSDEQLRQCCKILFETDSPSALASTHFKRCVMCLDLRENYIKKNQ